MLRNWFDAGAPVRALFFAALPAAAAAGGLALAPLIGLAGALSLRPSILRQFIENKPVSILLLLAFVAWAGVSTQWSINPDHSQWPKLAATLVLGLVFAAAAAAPATRRLTRAGAIAAFVVLVALLAVEATWNLPLSRAANPGAELWVVEGNPAKGVTILLGLGWAIAAGALADERPRLALATLAACGACATQFGQAANFAAFGLGLGAFALALIAPRFALMAISAALAAWMLAAPFATPLLSDSSLVERLPFSLAHRVGIWDFVSQRIVEAPVIGHGLDASRAVTDMIVVRGQEVSAVPLHPHSLSLQIWFETGGVGAALAALALWFGGMRLSRTFANNRPAAAAVCATLAAYGLLADLSFGAWQEWWNAAMLTAAAAIAAFAPQSDYAAASWHAERNVQPVRR